MLESKKNIYAKLEAFIRKYHFNNLIKGFLLFVGIGILYFLFTLMLEYFLWLSVFWRTLLFWFFVGTEVVLFIGFILLPLLRLFKLRSGLDYKTASVIIGNHFPEVSDTLLNFLQLSDSKVDVQSELLIASIDQKAASLQLVPFTEGVTFKSNLRFVPLALIPVFFVAYFYFFSSTPFLSQSYQRLIRYQETFVPPAPFSFSIFDQTLQVKKGENYVLDIYVDGSVLPQDCKVMIGDVSFFTEKIDVNHFQYTFTNVTASVDFHIQSNEVSSKDYTLKVIQTPSISSFKLKITYPSYLKKSSEIISGTGNALLPEGSRVDWIIDSEYTDNLYLVSGSSKVSFSKNDSQFKLAKVITSDFEYAIQSANRNVKQQEVLPYTIKVIKDQYPTISFKTIPDSVAVKHDFVFGQVSDDLGLHALQVVFYPNNQLQAAKKLPIQIKKDIYDQFYFSLSKAVILTEGVGYSYYFEVFDNDVLHNYKATRSTIFSTRVLTAEQREQESLQEQGQSISEMQQSIKERMKNLKDVTALEKLSKQKNQLDYKDQLKVEDFIKKEVQQQDQIKQVSEQLKKNLDAFQPEKKDLFKEELMKRLEDSQNDIDKNKHLLDELNKLNEKLKKEELSDKLEKIKQDNKSQAKSLEQLLELTKKFYVEKKVEQLSNQLDKLSDKQKELATDEMGAKKEQDQQNINDQFDALQKELDALKKENESLKSPMDLPKDKDLVESIDKALDKSSEGLKNKNAKSAKVAQKSAADKMKEMSKSMQEAMEADESEKLQEDVAMLRQILDNLLTFSFSQEEVMKRFKEIRQGSPSYPKLLKQQHNLINQFKHVDDSLVALSMRNPVISDVVHKEVVSVLYNMDKSIYHLTDAGLDKGLMHQQYAISSSNKLSDLLSDALTNMQMQMAASSSGKGKPKPGKGKGEMQLPDIGKSQKGISDKIKKGMDSQSKSGESGQPKPGSSGSEGMSGEVFEIYKQQQSLRESLENMLKKEGLGGAGQQTIDQMKALEKQLLNKGFTDKTLAQSVQLNHELLKLERALKTQGQDDKRQAETDKSKQTNTFDSQLPQVLKDYMRSIEVLNRQNLPLRSSYSKKVQFYFNQND